MTPLFVTLYQSDEKLRYDFHEPGLTIQHLESKLRSLLRLSPTCPIEIHHKGRRVQTRLEDAGLSAYDQLTIFKKSEKLAGGMQNAPDAESSPQQG